MPAKNTKKMTIVELYLHENGGSVTDYKKCIAKGERLGQAFFFALSDLDKRVLRGTIRDPFYKNDIQSVENAVDYLMERNHKS